MSTDFAWLEAQPLLISRKFIVGMTHAPCGAKAENVDSRL